MSFHHVIILVKLLIWHGYSMHQNKLTESVLLIISVTICPSFWYQIALSKVQAHGLILLHKLR